MNFPTAQDVRKKHEEAVVENHKRHITLLGKCFLQGMKGAFMGTSLRLYYKNTKGSAQAVEEFLVTMQNKGYKTSHFSGIHDHIMDFQW